MMRDGLGWLLLKAVIPWLVMLQLLPVMIYLERKCSAFIADRLGPNRAFIPGVGLRLAGVIHGLADVVKLLGKEEFIPNHVNRAYYLAAPAIALVIALMSGAVIPFTPRMEFADGTWFQIQGINAHVGLLYILALGSTAVYAVTLAGWASNNKYSLLGGLRGSAQMISYELAMGLAVVGLLMVYGSVDLNGMVEEQGGLAYFVLPRWGLLIQPVGFLLFLVGGFAETNRTPFDLPEGESEIVGFHVEYGAFKFAMFFMAEYIHIVVISLLIATCYFGGWQLPWVGAETLAAPTVAAGVAKGLLLATIVGGAFIGWKLLQWHRVNRTRWQDARRREGAVLSVLFGFAPALTALAILFLWDGTFSVDGAAVMGGFVGFLAVMLKTLFFCFFFVWVRWTLPRFRYDQLMGLGWKLMVPIGLLNILLTGLLVKLGVW